MKFLGTSESQRIEDPKMWRQSGRRKDRHVPWLAWLPGQSPSLVACSFGGSRAGYRGALARQQRHPADVVTSPTSKEGEEKSLCQSPEKGVIVRLSLPPPLSVRQRKREFAGGREEDREGRVLHHSNDVALATLLTPLEEDT